MSEYSSLYRIVRAGSNEYDVETCATGSWLRMHSQSFATYDRAYEFVQRLTNPEVVAEFDWSGKQISPEICPYCQTPKVNTGAPIWEDYCPNRECNGEARALRERIRAARQVPIAERDEALTSHSQEGEQG